jgi:hypothetical protein
MSGPSLRQLALAFLLFGVVGVAVFGRVVDNGYAFDAYYTVRDHPQVQPDASLVEVFSAPWWPGEEARGRALYRPLALLSFQLTRRLAADPLPIDHGIDLLLHVGCGVALLAFLMQMGAAFGAALTLALVFLLHPVQTEVVASLVGRTDLLATLTALLALNAALSRSLRGPAAWVAAGLLFSLSLLAKESTVALFVILPVCWAARELWSGRAKVEVTRGALGFAAVLGLAFVAHLVLRMAILGDLMVSEVAVQGDEARGFFALRWRALAFASLYAQKLVWPLPLLPDYLTGVVPDAGLELHARAVATLGAMVASVVWPLRSWLRDRALSLAQVGLLLFWLAMAPVSNLVIQIGTPFGERLVYFPFVFLLLAAAGLPLWRDVATGRVGSLPRLPVVWVVVLGAMALASAGRVPEWRDNRALFEAAVRDLPENYYSQLAFGATLMREGGGPYERDLAVRAFQAAARAREEAYPPWSMLGQLLYAEGDFAAARSVFEEAQRRATGLEREPSLLNLSRTYRALGDAPAVETLIVPEAEAHPEWTQLQREVGDYWRSRDRLDRALDCYERVLARAPDDVEAWRAVIETHLALGQREKARALIDSAPKGAIDYRFRLRLEREGLDPGRTSRD